MPIYEHSSETTTYSQPILTFPILSLPLTGVTITSGTFSIPLLLTAYNPWSRQPRVNTNAGLPIVDVVSNFAYGGTVLSHGVKTLPKIQLSGTIDTPVTVSGHNAIPTPVLGGAAITYGELILMFFEGRAGNWSRVNPVSFRDPYGRVFNNPRIFDYTASYVEAVPGRANFSMQLVV